MMPAVANVFGVVLALQTVFAILGMQLFSGAMGQCTNPAITTREECHAARIRQLSAASPLLGGDVIREEASALALGGTAGLGSTSGSGAPGAASSSQPPIDEDAPGARTKALIGPFPKAKVSARAGFPRSHTKLDRRLL